MITVQTSVDPETLRTAYRALLLPSFRPGELMDEDAFASQFPGRCESFLAHDADRLMGMAVLESFRHASLLQYLVAAPASRGLGVGTKLMHAVLQHEGAALVLAEFDHPDAHAPHPLHGDPEARLRFYARFGAIALELPYFQPPTSSGGEREHGMLLAVFDTDGAIAGRGRLTVEQSAAVQEYLHDVLGDEEDADAQRLRAAARVQGGIRVRPLDEYREIPRSPL